MTTHAFAADNGYKVIYDGGSVDGVKTGAKAELFIASSGIRLVSEGKDVATISPSAITEIS